MPETDLVALAARLGINTMVDLINDTDVDMDAIRTQYYYSKYSLDKIKISQDNYVYLKYAAVHTIPKGNSEWLARKNFPLTEHTVPLLDSVPPKSDKIRKEKVTGTFHQYGRYMEFGDRIDFNLLDPVIFEYADEYADVAIRTLHRLARKELLNSTMVYFANSRASFAALEIGDYVGLADFRLMALKFSRLAVMPIGGSFKVITSEEHMWDLMTDPLIIAYIGTNNGLEQYATGKLPKLFNVEFEVTQMDDYAYGYELSNPGEYYGTLKVAGTDAEAYNPGELQDVTVALRTYMATPDGNYVYTNVAASGHRTQYVSAEYAQASDFLTTKARSAEENLPDYDGTLSNNTTVAAGDETNNRLSDGSWVPIRTVWAFTRADFLGGNIADPVSTNAVKTAWGSFYVTNVDDTPGSGETWTVWAKYLDSDGAVQYEALGTIIAKGQVLLNVTAYLAELAAATTTVYEGTFGAVYLAMTALQLPVHKAIMLGKDALIRLGIEGEGNVQMFVKEKGSAGVLDPINQRQSIGFKINTVGFKRLREEASCVFYHVPTQAIATTRTALAQYL